MFNPKDGKIIITQGDLNTIFSYDKTNGHLTWRVGILEGKLAGKYHQSGYVWILFDSNKYPKKNGKWFTGTHMEHRIVYKMFYGNLNITNMMYIISTGIYAIIG